jgi:hypothetical protein
MIHPSTTQQGNKMNRDKIITLLEDGAFFDRKNDQFFHPSFRKGWRKMTFSNISWQAVMRLHDEFGTNRLQEIDGIYKLAA